MRRDWLPFHFFGLSCPEATSDDPREWNRITIIIHERIETYRIVGILYYIVAAPVTGRIKKTRLYITLRVCSSLHGQPCHFQLERVFRFSIRIDVAI